jgi:hypothetical protein
MLTACATSPTSVPESARAPAQSGVETKTAATEVAIESFANVAECRRYVATGTRIAVERCAPKGEDAKSAAAAAEHEMVLQDVEAMRRQQIYVEHARCSSVASACARSATRRESRSLTEWQRSPMTMRLAVSTTSSQRVRYLKSSTQARSMRRNVDTPCSSLRAVRSFFQKQYGGPMGPPYFNELTKSS